MEKLQESFFNLYEDDFMEFVEQCKSCNLLQREDYKSITDKISEIKEKNPNVRTFLEETEAIELTDSEQNALLDILSYDKELDKLEQKEIFKFGFREAYIFFNEMGLLKDKK